MPEEIENLEDENNVNEQGNSSSKSSPSSAASKAASNIIDFNKYKSRKNNKANIDSSSAKNKSGNNPKSTIPKKGSSAINGLKNKATNAMLDKVSNVHPALKALSVLNNINNARKAKKAAKAEKSENATANGEASDNKSSENTTNTTSSNTDDGTLNESLNPLSSISNFKDSILGNFSFFGHISLPKKITIIGIVLLSASLLLGVIPLLIIFGAFSGLFGADEITASGGTGNIDYGEYVLSSEGDEILHQPLDEFLSSKGTSLEAFNNLIASNVEKNGYGTREGVVTAAVTLIAELGNNYNVKVPYFWGGGHADGVVDGALGYWGSTQCHTYANGQSYNYCGLDCSGFVPWAIKNGGFNITPLVTGGFQSLPGAERVSLTNSAVLQPGDLLESSGHVILIVGVDDNNYICAEASGNETGVLFSTHPFNASGYWGVNMEGFYNTRARS